MAIALIVTALTLTAPSTSTDGAASGTAPTTAADLSLTAGTNPGLRKERRVIALTNAHRKRKGCRPLRARSALGLAAHRHSRAMARRHTLSHRVSGEPRLGVRVRRAGYTRWTRVGENIAYGYRSPRAVVQAWMRSAGHRRNILDCRFRHIGVGLVMRNGVPWWTQDFGRRRQG